MQIIGTALAKVANPRLRGLDARRSYVMAVTAVTLIRVVAGVDVLATCHHHRDQGARMQTVVRHSGVADDVEGTVDDFEHSGDETWIHRSASDISRMTVRRSGYFSGGAGDMLRLRSDRDHIRRSAVQVTAIGPCG